MDAVSAERFRALREHFHRLIDLPPPLRAAAMVEVEAELRDELSALLAHAAPVAIGPYRLESEIGRGGMGVVYRARRIDGAFEQTVALKRMHHGLGRESARLARERGILARLQHPHIARLLDGGVDDGGQPWMAMELIEGRPLLDATQALSQAARLDVLIDLCDAVSHAHSLLIVHRDIKPGNVLIASDGRPRLLDFGIAKLLDDSEQAATQTAWQPMTRRYAAPEQLRGEPATTAVDIYALGVLAGEVLGERPAPRLQRILQRARASDPAARYATAQALADDLRDARQGRALRSGIDDRWERALAFVRTHRWPLIAIGSCALALLGGGVATWHQAQRAEREAEQARRHLAALVDVIAAVSPDRYRGIEPPAGDVLLAASEALARSQPSRASASIGMAQSQLAAGLINLGRGKAAADVLERALDTDLSPDQAIQALRLWSLVVEDRATATTLASRIQSLVADAAPGPALSALASIAAALAQQGERDLAIQLLANAAAIGTAVAPHDAENYHRQRARALRALGDDPGAASAWADVVQWHTDYPSEFSAERQAEAAWMRADLALAMGDIALARTELARARPIIETAYPETHAERERFRQSLVAAGLAEEQGDLP
jgi:serine/threonine-protein kinase